MNMREKRADKMAQGKHAGKRFEQYGKGQINTF